MTGHNRALLKAVGGAVCISFSAVFVRAAEMEPAALGFYRVSIAGLVLFVLARISKERLTFPLRTYLWPALAGVFFALDLTLWHRCVALSGPGLATMLNNLQAIFVAAFAVCVGRLRFSGARALAMCSAGFGLFLITNSANGMLGGVSSAGFSWGIASAICYAGSIISLQYASSTVGSLGIFSRSTLMSAVAALLLLAECRIGGQSLVIATHGELVVVVGYALIAQVLGWWLIAGALELLPANRASMIFLLQPCLAYLWDVLLYGRSLTPSEVVGVMLVLVAVKQSA